MSVSDEAAAWLRTQEVCSFYEDGCCGDPDEHDYCGMCPLATAEHPDRNGGWPPPTSEGGADAD